MTTTPPGGWYPDPTGPPGLQRWWDGTAWTDQTQVAMAPLPSPRPNSGHRWSATAAASAAGSSTG